MSELIDAIRDLVAETADFRGLLDLQAQMEMASWAKWMFFASLAGLVLSALGILFVLRSLELNRAAVRAAVSANAQARELFIVGNRPWLRVTGARFDSFEEDEGREMTFLSVDVENVGNSHAVNVEIFAEAHKGHFFLAGHRLAREFAEKTNYLQDFQNTVIFSNGSDNLVPVNPIIDPLNGSALVCITYRNAADTSQVYKTACAIELSHGVRIMSGSMYVS